VKILYCSTTRLGEELYEELFWGLSDQKCVIEFGHDYNEEIKKYPEDYDLGVSFLYTHKIPAEQIQNHIWINFHPGPLPEMRGRNLAYHAIMEGRKEFGATLHYMDADYDTGDIIECRRFPIFENETAGDLVQRTHKVLAEMFREWMARFIAGEKIIGMSQSCNSFYYRKEKIDEMIELQPDQIRKLRALTVAGKYYAKVEVDGKIYKIVPEDEL